MPSSAPSLLATALKVILIPTIGLSAAGSFLGLLLVVFPFLGIFFLPTLVFSLATFVFALPTLMYLHLAQSDPPPEARLPFIALSPTRNLVLSVTILRWGWSALRIGVQLFKSWCQKRVWIVGKRRNKEPVASENIPYHNGHTLSVYHPAKTAVTPSSPRPIIIIVPSPTSLLPTTFLALLALRLRLSYYLVVVPTSGFPVYPEATLSSSVVLTRHMIAWTARNAVSLGGDADQIYLLGHGMGSLVAMMAGGLRDSIVKSRDEWLWERFRRNREESGGSIGYGAGGDDWERDGEIGLGEGEMDELDGEGVDEVPNGLKRVEIWGGEVEIPRVAGIVALSPLTDAPQQIRHEASLHIEHLSSTRRFLGPSQTDTMLASPSHLLYAAKNVLDVEGRLIRKWLIIHGGKDEFIPVSQSSLMRELLVGLGVPNVRFRAYKEMNHIDTVTSLMSGVSSPYSELVLRDIESFIPNH